MNTGLVVVTSLIVVLVIVGIVTALLLVKRRGGQVQVSPPGTGSPTALPEADLDGAAKPALASQAVVEAEAAADEAAAQIDAPAPAPTEHPAEAEAPASALTTLETPELPASRLQRLRSRLAKGGGIGQALLAVLSRGQLGREDWDEFEETLLLADVGAGASEQILDGVRTRLQVQGAGTNPVQALKDELMDALDTGQSRLVNDQGEAGLPGVVLVVGVNGSGKTTTIGRLARLEVAQGRSVVLGAADTFRAAAAEQLTTWGERVGVSTVRGAEGADPASVAFDAVAQGIAAQVDTVIIDTAGRLHNKANLMDELSKIKKVAAKQAPITETLLVLDATTGQNGLIQARVFTEVVDVTGIVLTKLDGTAKGGIVIAVQRELGVPVKLVGLGEGPDDLAPFEPNSFVEAIMA